MCTDIHLLERLTFFCMAIMRIEGTVGALAVLVYLACKHIAGILGITGSYGILNVTSVPSC